jgi:hypothetical protein
MAAFQVLISGLRRAEKQLETQLASVRSAISSLELGGGGIQRLTGRRGRKRGTAPPRRRRRLSAKARKAISDAQKKRWAKIKSAK